MNRPFHTFYAQLPLIFAVLASSLYGQITDVTATASNLQAIISYKAPTEEACLVAVSESPDYLPPVADVDPSRFTDSNLDNQAGSPTYGRLRTFVVGKRLSARATDGTVTSRALQAATPHYFRIDCGPERATGSFTTTTIPFGNTHSDAIPADPENPGQPFWPQLDYRDRNKTYVDPHTGALLRRLTGPADIYDLGTAGDFLAWAPQSIVRTGVWTGTSGFPYTVTNSDTPLVLLASGLRGWGTYPFTTAAQRYSSDVGGHLNWLVLQVTARTSDSACNSSNPDNCTLVVCLSTDRISCHPYSRQVEVPLTSSQRTTQLGQFDYTDQGGWIQPGKRWLNGPEISSYGGSVTCDGSTLVTGGPFNLAWNPGSKVTINEIQYEIASLQHEEKVTLTTTCPAGTWSYQALNFSILVRPKAPSTATITVNSMTSKWEFGVPPQWSAAAYWDFSSAVPVNGASNQPGYMVMIPSFQGIYWVNGNTGDSRLLTQDVNVNVNCFGQAPLFDVRNGAKWYCANSNTIRSFEYLGNYADRLNGPSSGFNLSSVNRIPDCIGPNNNNRPCLINSNLTAGVDIQSLVRAFDPLFDPAKFGVFLPTGINQDGSFALIAFRSAENTPGWIIFFDPYATSNGEPANAGCISAAVGDPTRKGCIVAALPTWLRGLGRGQPLKGDIIPNLAAGWVRYYPMYWSSGAPGAGYGPWQMDVPNGFSFNTSVASGSNPNEIPGGLNECPANTFLVSGKRCTVVTVGSEPYDPTPFGGETGLPAEYLNVQAGDWLVISSSQYTINYTHVTELVRVIGKSGLNLVLARGQRRGKDSCAPADPINCGAGSSTPLVATNATLYLAASSPAVYWNYARDPHGLSGATYETKLGNSHSFGRFGTMVEAPGAGGGYDPRCAHSQSCYAFTNAAGPQEVTQIARTGVAPNNPPFAGKVGFATPNNVQTHPSAMGHASSALEKEFFLDARPFNGIYNATDAKPVATNVDGPLWKFAAGALALNRKFVPTKAQNGWHPLYDLSGLESSIGTGATDAYRYCVVQQAGECYAGSVKDEVYFNVPYLRLPFCSFPGQASASQDITDICILDQGIAIDSMMQMRSSVSGDPTGSTQRVLSKGFVSSRMNVPFWNIQALPNNKWGLFRSRFLNGFRTEAMLVKFPPLTPVDSTNRSTFIPLLIAPPDIPVGATNVTIEFGYAENGPADKLYCTPRAETCAVGRASASDKVDVVNPYWFSTTEAASLEGTPCVQGCIIAIPVLPGRVVYYRLRYRDGANNTVSTTGIQAALVP